jgi:hypothetical protein
MMGGGIIAFKAFIFHIHSSSLASIPEKSPVRVSGCCLTMM